MEYSYIIECVDDDLKVKLSYMDLKKLSNNKHANQVGHTELNLNNSW